MAAALKRERIELNKVATTKFKAGDVVKWEEANNTFASGVIQAVDCTQYFIVKSTQDGRLQRIEASEALVHDTTAGHGGPTEVHSSRSQNV